MAKDMLDKIIDCLKEFPELYVQKFAEKAKPLVEEKLENSVNNFYMDYTPINYVRTNNFKDNVELDLHAEGQKLIIDVNSDMNDYPGWWGKPLNADTAWYYMYERGWHGYGDLLFRKETQPSPDQDMRDYFNSGFDGKQIDMTYQIVNEILKEKQLK